MKRVISIAGIDYIHVSLFADRMGVTVPTVYNWKSEGRLEKFSMRYLGKLYMEEKAIEPFKKSLMEKG